MLITVNTQTFQAEASALPYRHSFDSKRQSGNGPALTGRCAS